jgi:hypothetical protein
MNSRSISAFLGALCAFCLLLSLAGCSSSGTDEIFGANDPAAGTLASDGTGDDESADEGADEGDDEEADDPCDGMDDGSIYELILVADGEVCELNGTRVRGDIIVGAGSVLMAHGVGVGGDVRSEGGRSITVDASSGIRGSVILARCGDSTIENSDVAMTIHLKQNFGALSVRNNTVGANIEVFENTGGVLLEQNMIGETLTCIGNDPAPTGQGNTAASKEDQCADL